MKYIKKKIFWNNIENEKIIHTIRWDETEMEYYAFIKSNIDEGYHQVVVNSEMMLGLVSLCAKKSNWSIVQIEMMEEDEEMKQELASLIDDTRDNKGAYLSLLEILKTLLEDDSIDIKRIYIQAKYEKQYENFFIQVNGLIGESSDNADCEKEVLNYIREYMNV